MAVANRMDVSKPHALWGKFNPNAFHVSKDAGQLRVRSTSLQPDQYYKFENKSKWRRYDTPQQAPGNVGGFHKAFLDTKQPGST
ncbi:hypothetical protein HDU98_008811, partial [Podochytrium sp. JEL0797]